MDNNNKIISIPLEFLDEVGYSKYYKCPCGKKGIREFEGYKSVDDADPLWGQIVYDLYLTCEECKEKYNLVKIDHDKNEAVLEIK